jgi:hypothetical protein
VTTAEIERTNPVKLKPISFTTSPVWPRITRSGASSPSTNTHYSYSGLARSHSMQRYTPVELPEEKHQADAGPGAVRCHDRLITLLLAPNSLRVTRGTNLPLRTRSRRRKCGERPVVTAAATTGGRRERRRRRPVLHRSSREITQRRGLGCQRGFSHSLGFRPTLAGRFSQSRAPSRAHHSHGAGRRPDRCHRGSSHPGPTLSLSGGDPGPGRGAHRPSPAGSRSGGSRVRSFPDVA